MKRLRHYRYIMILFFTFCFSLNACSTVTVTPKMVKRNLSIWTPKGEGPFPVVIFYQGGGAHNRRAWAWAKWFETLGVASAIIANAQMRGRNSNTGKDKYPEDAALVWDILQSDPRIDTSRLALMGFSVGGWMALTAGRYFQDERVKPDFVFALYPGHAYDDNTCFCSHDEPTKVYIFYGDSDDAEQFGFISACSRLAKSRDNIEIHLFKGAEHGYDDDVFPFVMDLPKGYTIEIKYNDAAVEKTRGIIRQAIKTTWDLRDID